MAKILADDLENNPFSSLVEFVASRSNVKLTRRGKRIEITGLTNKKIKFLLHKFLHTNHLSEYSVLARADTFEIARIRPKRSREHEILKRRMPFVPIPPPPTAVKPRLVIEWQGKHPTKKTRNKK